MFNNNENFDNVVNLLDKKEKELECLYNVDFVLKDFNSDLFSVLSQLIKVIPIGWRYPDICKIKISIFNLEVESENYKKSELNVSADLIINDSVVGEISLCYVKPVRTEKRIFLDEENRLFQTIVEKINQYISYRKLKELFSKKSEGKNNENFQETNFTNYLKDLFLTDKDIEKIIKVPIDLKKDEIICKQGTFASFIMILKEGLLKALVENSHKNHIFKITKPYSIIGLSSLYGDNYYHFSCVAMVTSKVYIIERSNFDKIIKSNPKFAMEIMKLYSNSLQNVYNKLGAISNKQALGRVCDTLLYLSEKVFESNFIDTIISRKEIAEFSGLATENLVRILAELKKDNIIAINNKAIEILKPETLKLFSNIG
ncbi:MAG: Crp/Fnr family transcriptional regulator [Bacteroidales bacterium]|jgi:CRP/FNR family transcriptional regulator|nr:Crp/Fnr family transcriptional regulator [Bacteroidales bacterium]